MGLKPYSSMTYGHTWPVSCILSEKPQNAVNVGGIGGFSVVCGICGYPVVCGFCGICGFSVICRFSDKMQDAGQNCIRSNILSVCIFCMNFNKWQVIKGKKGISNSWEAPGLQLRDLIKASAPQQRADMGTKLLVVRI